MGRTGSRLPGFCLNRIRPHIRVRSPPAIPAKPEADSADANQQEAENSGNTVDEEKPSETAKAVRRKVMIVVDSSIETKGALHWALTHTVQRHDTVVLLHVIRPTQQGPFLCSLFGTIVFDQLSVSITKMS